jgi:phage gp36-like protein
MSHKHKVIIEKIFAHPIATNVDWKKLQHALEHFGAEIDVSNANKAKVTLREHEIVLGLPHHGHELADKDEITKLRHFLESVKLTPDTI